VVQSKCNAVSPGARSDSPLRGDAETAVLETTAAWNRFAPQAALEATWRLIGATNSFLEQNAPWKMEPGSEVEAVMGDALEAIRIVSILITPAMPTVASEIWRRIGLSGLPTDGDFNANTKWGLFPKGVNVEKGDPLFPRIKSD
jgi:methionyl-tRNA synthetase